MGGQAGRPGQGGGVLRHAEELNQAGSLDVGVHEDRPFGAGQAVGEGGGHGRAPGGAMGSPHQDDPSIPTVARRHVRT